MATSFGFLPGALAADVYENVWTDVSTLSNDYPNAPSDWFYPGDPLTIELMNDVVNSDGNEDIFDTAAYHPRCGRFACDWTGSEHITLLDIDDAVLDSSGRFTHTYPGDDTKSLYDGDYRIWAAYEDYHENSGPGGRILRGGAFTDFEIHKYRADLTFDRSAYIPGETVTVFYTVTDIKTGALISDANYEGEWVAVDLNGNQLRDGSMPGTAPQGSFTFLIPATAPAGGWYDVTLWWNDTLTGGQVRQWVEQDSVWVDNLFAMVTLRTLGGTSTPSFELGATALVDVRVTVGGSFSRPVAGATVDITVYRGLGTTKTAITGLGGTFETSQDGTVRYLFAVTSPNFAEDSDYTVEADASKEQQRMTPIPVDTFGVTSVVDAIAVNLEFDQAVYTAGQTMIITVRAEVSPGASPANTFALVIRELFGSVNYLSRVQPAGQFTWDIPPNLQGTVYVSVEVYNADGDFGSDADTRDIAYGIVLVNADPSTFTPGSTITISFELVSQRMTSPEFFYEVRDGTLVVKQGPVTATGMGGTFTFSVPSFPATDYGFRVFANDEGLTAQGQDVASLALDYVLTLTFDGENYRAGETVTITYEIQARGTLPLPPAFIFSTTVGNSLAATHQVNRTGSGTSFSGTLTFSVPENANEGDLLVTVFESGTFATATEVISVKAPAPPPPPAPFMSAMDALLLLLIFVLLVLLLIPMMRRPKPAGSEAAAPVSAAQETTTVSGTGMTVPCRSCGRPIDITTSKRPIEVMCPNCGSTEVVK